MHEQLIREFADRAEAEVELPDLQGIEERAHLRRRNRHVSTAVAVAVAVAAVGVGVLSGTGDDRSAPPPSQDPGLQVDDPVPEKQVAAGREYLTRVFGQNYSETIPEGQTIVAEFTVVGQDWVWLRDAVGKLVPGTGYPESPFSYAEVQMSMVDRVPVRQCPAETVRWQDGARDPLGLARQVGELPNVEVLRAPRATTWSGYPAAQVRLRVTQLCPEWRDAVLWSVFPSSSRDSAGVGAAYRVGQVVDAWFVDVEGSNVVVALMRSPDLPPSLRAEAAAIAESVRLDLVDE
jgi:hypothetical protein